jgi:hypothetical protein
MKSICDLVEQYNGLVTHEAELISNDKEIQMKIELLKKYGTEDDINKELNDLKNQLEWCNECHDDFGWEKHSINSDINTLLIKSKYLELAEILKIACKELVESILSKKEEMDIIKLNEIADAEIVKRNSNIAATCVANTKINNFIFINKLDLSIKQGIKFKFPGNDTEFILGYLNCNTTERKIIISNGTKYKKNGLIKLVQVTQDLILNSKKLEVSVKKGTVYNFDNKYELVFEEDTVILI